MNVGNVRSGMALNVRVFPWMKFFQSLAFHQAIWFLYFQDRLSGADAILLYVVYDLATTVLEVPSGYMSDRFGRRRTLVLAAVCGVVGAACIALGAGFLAFAIGHALFGASSAFSSGTDSAILFESLAADERVDEVEGQELRAWRFSYIASAVSAVLGGVLAFWSGALAFVATGAAFIVMFALVWRMEEPPRSGDAIAQGGEWVRVAQVRDALVHPVLMWLFALTVLMYGYSHLTFVFGQPFILEALKGLDLSAEAPLVSGTVSAVMMGVAVLASLIAPQVRRALGLGPVLLLAFGLQIVVISVLAATNAVIAIAIIFVRMVPNAFSRPFIMARIQPELNNESRATYLSLQMLFGRLLLAASLYFAAGAAGPGEMAFDEIRTILGWYVAGGLVCFAVLVLALRRVDLS